MGRVLAVAVLAAALVVGVSLAQARTDRETANSKALPGLPAWTAGYKAWFKVNARPIRPKAADAHLGTKNVYASKRIRGSRYPYGTVIVKEITRPNSGFVGVIAAMRKVRGFSPRNNDWQMIEWTRSSRSSRFGVLAQGTICYSCHVGAKRNDFVWTKR